MLPPHAYASADGVTAWNNTMIPQPSESDISPGEKKLICKKIRQIMDGNGTIGLLDEQLSPSFESQVEIDDVDAFPMITENADKSNLNAVARRDEIRTNIVLSNAKKAKLRAYTLALAKNAFS